MRLRRLDLIRYGHFSDRSLELPSGQPDLHIVVGPNEAGKSTALSAVEDLLFGIPSKSPLNFLHDYGEMRIGAALEADGEVLEVRRRKGMKGTLLSADDQAMPSGEHVLRPFLRGADRNFFKRMFGLDHARLRRRAARKSCRGTATMPVSRFSGPVRASRACKVDSSGSTTKRPSCGRTAGLGRASTTSPTTG